MALALKWWKLKFSTTKDLLVSGGWEIDRQRIFVSNHRKMQLPKTWIGYLIQRFLNPWDYKLDGSLMVGIDGQVDHYYYEESRIVSTRRYAL